MPSQMRSESGCHDWSTSYVHLYKLHRGITTAVIQDICFSHDNQWIAIVSSKGTCHIFVISPFGGDTGIQALHSHIQGSILYPDSSPPWWPTSSFAVNEKCSSLPPPSTLSVVSRIKSSDSGLLNSDKIKPFNYLQQFDSPNPNNSAPLLSSPSAPSFSDDDFFSTTTSVASGSISSDSKQPSPTLSLPPQIPIIWP
ncbi:BCAS3 domain-containing protein [Forsythia ovata]|uniref:BCAS3 domain-containing protein n=1 Tax=Forsythia ovata TaxID=205694 RepID=A0ABD1V155_9LAMI